MKRPMTEQQRDLERRTQALR